MFIHSREDVEVERLGQRGWKGPSDNVCRIATLNVNSLKHKAEEVVTIMKDHDIHILCLQEVKMGEGELSLSY